MHHHAAVLGIDLSTTKTGVAVRSAEGVEGYADTKNTNAKDWKGQPAFDLSKQAALLLSVLESLRKDGWRFNKPGTLSLSVRQHDMAVLGSGPNPLIPALMWQADAATKEVQLLRKKRVEEVVGRVEERFILPKLVWALAKDRSLRKSVRHVMTTGDWIAWQLTGERRLSTSDALSNGLLEQSTRELATGVLEKAGLNPEWFPKPAKSGEVVGTISEGKGAAAGAGPFAKVRTLLKGWRVVAGLGDNHATGVGTGGLVDRETIVVSVGTSGTVNRRISAVTPSPSDIARFEFYDDRMLLLMLHECGDWYQAFKAQYPEEITDREFSLLATEANPEKLSRVQPKGGPKATGGNVYPKHWAELSLGEKTASMQFSIMAGLLALVKKMDQDVKQGEPTRRYLLTGGLSQSPLIQHLFEAGIRHLAGEREVGVQVSDREGPLAFQTAAYGALINATLPDHGGNLSEAAVQLCRFKPCPSAPPLRRSAMMWAMKAAGL